MNKSKIKALLPYIIIPVIAVLLISAFETKSLAKSKQKELKYYEVIELFENDKITECSLNFNSRVLTYKTADEPKTVKKYTVPDVDLFLNDTHEHIMEHNAANPKNPIILDYQAGSSYAWLFSILPTVGMFALMMIFYYMMYSKADKMLGSENDRALSFGKARITEGKDEKNKKTFADVAGADEEKADLVEIVDFLKDPSQFSELGATLPKGVLLVGPPGTGKTLLAKAVAGEADVPFLSISGSDFLEMYVGVGAARVRDLFGQAKKQAPCIIFIDEIDAVGRHRGAGMGGGHDEREQTLNQMLVEMDGFGENEGVIVMAATNRPDILDPALLRPGRFDRQITVSYPDVKGREEILAIHAKKKPLGPDVDLAEIAKNTVGFTGADLANLLNEAALLAARAKKKAVTMTEIHEATMKVIVGTEKKSHKVTMEDKRITANHEAGHAVVTYYLPTQDPVTHISIVQRGRAAGFTLSTPQQDKMHVSKQYMLDELCVLLGGRVAEALTIGDICTGASNDIERATAIARDMITKYGMSETLGPINFAGEDHEVFLGKDYGNVRNYSESIAAAIDKEIKELITQAYARTEEILKAHLDQLTALADYLIEHEKIGTDDFNALMNGTLTEKAAEEATDETPAEEPETAEVTAENTTEDTAEAED